MQNINQAVDSVSCKLIILQGDSAWFVQYLDMDDRLGLPGGRIDQGESIDEAIRRETQEELGVDVLSYKIIDANFVYADSGKDGQNCLELYFLAEIDGKPRDEVSQDNEKAVLVKISDLDNHLIAERFKKIVQESSNG